MTMLLAAYCTTQPGSCNQRWTKVSMSCACTYYYDNFLALTAHKQAARLHVNKGGLADDAAASE